MSDQTSSIYLYQEKQRSALCAVHAINTLLQGPFCNEIDLSEIAISLDEMERQLLGDSWVPKEDEGNVDASGMFSIQVVSAYLQEMWALQAISLTSPEAATARADPQQEQAFICNLQEHWFTIRCVYGDWYNFNSLFAAPQQLSPFYLSAFLGSLQEQGYSIYVIKGQLPSEPHPDAGNNTDTSTGQWFTPDQARVASQQTEELKQQGLRNAAVQGVMDMATQGTRVALRSASLGPSSSQHTHGDEADADLARALAASRQDMASSGMYENDEDADLAAAIACSLQDAGAGPSGADVAGQPGAQDTSQGGPDDEPEVQLPQLGEEPVEGSQGVLEIVVRLPSGDRCKRRFAESDSVGHVLAFASAQGVPVDPKRHKLTMAFPRKVLEDLTAPLVEAGVGSKQMLTLEYTS